MIPKIFSGAIVGLSTILVEVEVNIVKKGLPSFAIVGLGDKAIAESKERVRSAILNIGADFPTYRITVNLAPADIKKTGSQYDLAIALGYLLASKQIKSFETDDKIFVGELSLDGSLRPVHGILSVAILAREEGVREVFVPAENAAEALSQFLPQYYVSAADIPPLIFTGEEITEKHALEEWLTGSRGHRVQLLTPERGKKNKLVSIASKALADPGRGCKL